MGKGGMEIPAISRSAPCSVPKGRIMYNTGTLQELCRALNIDHSEMIERILGFIRQTIADEQ